jgi:mitogen-activated protein kinase kinase kinase
MMKDNALYATDEFQRKTGAIITWHNVTTQINLELDLLKSWTGNAQMDPTLTLETKDVEDQKSLVERFIQNQNFTNIFNSRLVKNTTQLLHQAQEATLEYAEEYVELGLPLFNEGLVPLMAFPYILLREIIQLRLVYAKRMQDPTHIIIDQMMEDLQMYLSLSVELDKMLVYVIPILDKGWALPNPVDEVYNNTLLECIQYYLDTLNRKVLEPKGSSIFRPFKETETLEQHFSSLIDVCRSIDGGDIIVAEQFTALQSKMLNRLLAYWEAQIKGPSKWTESEVSRWFTTTSENIRSFQRKQLRFHR